MSKTAVAAAVEKMLSIRAMHCADVVIGMVLQNPVTGQVTNVTYGSHKPSDFMDVLEVQSTPVAKIEPPVVATIAPTQTAVNPPTIRRRGRPAGSKNKSTAAPVAAAVETPVETTTPVVRRRGRPAGSKNKSNASSTPAASTPEATTTKGKKPHNKGMQVDIFNQAEFIGTLVHCSDKGTKTPVYIISESPKGCKVASPQKDQSGVAVGYIKCAVWFSVLAKQESKSNSLNIAKLFS